jgi:hypothetical protein
MDDASIFCLFNKEDLHEVEPNHPNCHANWKCPGAFVSAFEEQLFTCQSHSITASP